MGSRELVRPVEAPRRMLLAGAGAVVALAWVPLGLLHPTGEEMLAGHTATWLAVHWVQTALLPLVGLVMWWVLDLPGPAATVARVAVLVWVASLAAFGAVAAIANGLLVEGGFSEAAAHLWERTQTGVVLPMGIVAHLAWVVAAVAGSLALRAHGAPRVAQAAMLLAALLMATGHGDVFSSVGAVALAVAVYVSVRARAHDDGPDAGGDREVPSESSRAGGTGSPTASPRIRHGVTAHLGRLRRHGLAVAVVGALGCGVTTLLVAAGALSAGGGLLGGPEAAVLAAVAPLALVTWRLTARTRRQRRPESA